MRVLVLAVALVLLPAVAVVTGPAARAADPTNTTPATALTLTELPFLESQVRVPEPLPESTDSAAALVANSCQGGGVLLAAGWFRYTAAEAHMILVKGNDFTYPSGSRPTGVAVVEADLSTVKACALGTRSAEASTGPVGLSSGETVYVVRWIISPVPPGVEQTNDATPVVYVARTSGVVPPNDDVDSPTPITTVPFIATVDTTLATQDGPYCDDSPLNSVWWSFVPPVTGGYSIIATSDSPVYQPCVSVFVREGLQSPGGNGLQAGTEYLIKVSGGYRDYYPATLNGGGVLTLNVATLDPTSPVWTSLPRTSVPLGSRLTTTASACLFGVYDSTLPVAVDFAAADPETGISGYFANGQPLGLVTRLDGAVYEGDTACSMPTTSYVIAASNGQDAEVSLPWDSDRLAVVEDPNLTGQGAWTTVATSTASSGSVRRSTASGASLTYRVPATMRNQGGTAINTGPYVATLIMATGPDRGRVNVLVDGRRVATVDTYSGAAQPRTVVWRRNLTAGAHTVRVVNQATPGRRTVDVDGLAFVLQ